MFKIFLLHANCHTVHQRNSREVSPQLQHNQGTAPLQAPPPAPPTSAQSSLASQCSYHDSPWADLQTDREISTSAAALVFYLVVTSWLTGFRDHPSIHPSAGQHQCKPTYQYDLASGGKSHYFGIDWSIVFGLHTETRMLPIPKSWSHTYRFCIHMQVSVYRLGT